MNYLEEYFLPLFSDLCGLGVFARDIPCLTGAQSAPYENC
ncbi:MAG: hypothetical protein HW419_2977 [Deltaproteobacteria bacterium]|nr:hypothetical protein [Deltaproteobacteria bacterium]